MIREPQRPLREALFALFFPEALVRQFEDKSKSNLTWFFTSDARNKSVRRALAALLRERPRETVDETHGKCRAVLWPAPGRPAFDGAALRRVLGGARLPQALENRAHILEGVGGAPGRLDRFYEADEAAALARVILTLAVAGDAPADALDALWQTRLGEGGFMRSDDSPAGRLRYCRLLDLQGDSDRAFAGYERLARQLDRPAQTVDEAAMYCRLGEMLFTGEGCARDEKSAQAFDRLACMDGYPRAWHQLSRHSTGTPAREALEHAAELGYGPAIRELGAAWTSGSARLACVRNPEAARRVFQRGMTLPGADGAWCAFMLGQIHEAQGEREAAANAYRVAQEGGSAEAAERLARLDWVVAPPKAAAEKPQGVALAGYCLVNGDTGCNRLFVGGLQGRWQVVRCGGGASPEEALRDLARGVYWGGAPTFPPLVIALLSEDWQGNVMDAVALLGALRQLAEALGERAWDLADAVRLYVLSDHGDAAPLLDAAFAGMGGLYFRLRLCDPALDAADRLLAGAPLFLPRLRAAGDAPVRVKLVGCGDVAMAVLRRAAALPLPRGGEVTIDVYGAGAGAMARRFYQLCPGLKAAPELGGPLPDFHECPPEEGLLDAMDALAGGNYFVVAAGDDALNLRLGMLLRGELLKRDPGAARQPFIAVHTRHPVAGWLGGSLPAGPEGSQYDLTPFGMLDMYAPQALENDVLERRARQAHMLFIGAPNTPDARHAAMGGYYRRQQGRDTARLTALALAYRMHLAGLGLAGWRLYGVPEEEARLGGEYTRWLREKEHLQAALRDEHDRRNRMLLSLGWAPATGEQVERYVGRGNPGHLLYPARLDPFICPIEALEDGELLKRIRDIVRARFPEKSVPDPRRDEEASVRDTEAILGS